MDLTSRRTGRQMTEDLVHRERGLLGPYLLGQLDQDETELVTKHLSWCSSCQQEHQSLLDTSELLKWYIGEGGEI
jgi:anti-sigma factor RsiW